MALVTTRMRRPLSLDEVTPEWLAQALSTRTPGTGIGAAVRDLEPLA